MGNPRSYDDTLKEFKNVIRKLKIDSALGNKNILSKLKYDIERNVNHALAGPSMNSVAKKFSKYGCVTGSYLYSTLGIVSKTQFKDLDLIVSQEMFDKLEEEHDILQADGWYTHVKVSSAGFIKYKNTIIDLFIKDDVEYVEKDNIKFQKNVLDALEMKLEIYKNRINENSDLYYITIDVHDMISVLKGRLKPFEISKENKIFLKEMINKIFNF